MTLTDALAEVLRLADEIDPDKDPWPRGLREVANDLRALAPSIQAMADDARRYAFCVEHGVWPALSNDGQRWVMFVAVTSRRRSTFVAPTASEAIDAAIDALNPIAKGE